MLDCEVTRFSDLLRVHEKLDEFFAQHQELLIERRLPEAKAILRLYRELTELHMRQEEELLLPIYERSGASPRWPLALFTGQHQRLRALLRGAEQRLEGLRDLDVRPRTIVELIDYERTYKHLMEHHDGAERQGLFPALDRTLATAEQREITLGCLGEWRQLERELGQKAASLSSDSPFGVIPPVFSLF